MVQPQSVDPVKVNGYVNDATAVLRNFSHIVSDNIFVLDAIPRGTERFFENYQDDLRRNRFPHPGGEVNTTASLDLARSILKRAVQSCAKCSTFDYVPTFTANGKFQLFDIHAHVAYENSVFHFTPYGLHRLRPLYKGICDKFTKKAGELPA
ncbi:unnamed protein product [Heligmosomoides polygyrus]|uniref:SGNH domain-containing protein n=1 Tax=Heligmosomoides polygyrus TaxID=6339 RepID=A0A183GN61_HELPZ|nr:unnamed protein product [Heligmosomoides polygyrus]